MAITFLSNTFWSADLNNGVIPEKLYLQTIVPKVGESRVVFFGDSYDKRETIECNLLWQPPYSEREGYSEQPSEILRSYVVSGKAFLKCWQPHHAKDLGQLAPAIPYESNEYVFTVTEVRLLIDLCYSLPSQTNFKFPEINGQKGFNNLWEDAHWCGLAEVGDFVYLQGGLEYVHLGALFQQTSNALILKMHIFDSPSGDEAYITNYSLSVAEQRIFEKLMSKADLLSDRIKNYLI